MERTSSTNLNGRNEHKSVVLDKKLITDSETLEAGTAPNPATEADVRPQVEPALEEVKPQPPEKPKGTNRRLHRECLR